MRSGAPHNLLIFLLELSCFVCLLHASGQTHPNVLLILADDAGFGDFESTDEMMVTPNIRKLRVDGMFLNQSYVLPMCAPSRAALMTGRYPHTFGSQDSRYGTNVMDWLNENFTFLPQELQALGYRTHALGKWHLSHCHPGLIPTGRGFDTFYGFLTSGHVSYYNHSTKKTFDWFDGSTPDWGTQGKYQTDLLNARAVQIINNTNSGDQPFFMYLAYGAPHSPIEVPLHYEDEFCSHVTDKDRKTYCAMVAVMDHGIGNIVQTLKQKGMYDNTAILFLSDNGGATAKGSNNWPLRGGKQNLYEGGIRSYTVLKAPGLKRVNVTWSHMIHMTDWFPTLVEMAGGFKPDYVHGKSLWKKLKAFRPSSRKSFITVNDFENFNHVLLRYKQWKFMRAIPGLPKTMRWRPGSKTGWYAPFQLRQGEVQSKYKDKKYSRRHFLLYNLDEDPYEKNNTASYFPQVVRKLKRLVKRLLKKYPVQRYRDRSEFQTSDYAFKDHAFNPCFCNPPGFKDRNITCPEP